MHIDILCDEKIYKGSFSISVETSCQINQNFPKFKWDIQPLWITK